MKKDIKMYVFLALHCGFDWVQDEEDEEGKLICRHFMANDMFVIQVFEEEIVFVDDSGDFLHLPNNIYALAGALVHNRAIPYNFSLPK